MLVGSLVSVSGNFFFFCCSLCASASKFLVSALLSSHNTVLALLFGHVFFLTSNGGYLSTFSPALPTAIRGNWGDKLERMFLRTDGWNKDGNLPLWWARGSLGLEVMYGIVRILPRCLISQYVYFCWLEGQNTDVKGLGGCDIHS